MIHIEPCDTGTGLLLLDDVYQEDVFTESSATHRWQTGSHSRVPGAEWTDGDTWEVYTHYLHHSEIRTLDELGLGSHNKHNQPDLRNNDQKVMSIYDSLLRSWVLGHVAGAPIFQAQVMDRLLSHLRESGCPRRLFLQSLHLKRINQIFERTGKASKLSQMVVWCFARWATIDGLRLLGRCSHMLDAGFSEALFVEMGKIRENVRTEDDLSSYFH